MKHVAALAIAGVIAIGPSMARADNERITGVPSSQPHRGLNTYAFNVPGYDSLGYGSWFAIPSMWTDPATGAVIQNPMAATQAASIEKSIQDKTSADFLANCDQIVLFHVSGMACRVHDVDSVNKR